MGVVWSGVTSSPQSPVLCPGQELGGLGAGGSAFQGLPSHSGLRFCLGPRLWDGRRPQGLSEDDNPLYAWKQLEEKCPGNGGSGMGGSGPHGHVTIYRDMDATEPATFSDFLNTKCNLLKTVL